MATDSKRDPRPTGMFTGKPNLKQAFTTLAKAPFKFLGGVTEKVVAPIALAPYQIATDKVVADTIRDHASPFKFSYDVEFDNATLPTDHKIDLTGSSVKRGFSFKGGPHLTNNVRAIVDHEIRLKRLRRDPGYEVDPEPEFESRSAPPAQDGGGGGYAPSYTTPPRQTLFEQARSLSVPRPASINLGSAPEFNRQMAAPPPSRSIAQASANIPKPHGDYFAERYRRPEEGVQR